MNEITALHQALTRILLIGSFVVFAAGAAVPAMDGFWGMSLEESLLWIASHPGRWAFSAVSFIVSLMLCVSGLAVFDQFFRYGAPKLFSSVAFHIYFIGSVLWIISMAFRLSVRPWAGQILSQSSSLADSFVPLQRLESTLFDIFMLSTFLASSLYGLALLQSQQFPSGLGWFSLVYGLLMAAFYAISGGPIPIMVLVVPLVLGLSPYPGPGLQN